MIHAKDLTMADAVTTFMYASGVNVILANSPGLEPLSRSLLPIGLILFLSIDWLGRVRLPMGFPEADQKKRRWVVAQLAKGLTEMVCVYVFVIAAISLVLATGGAASAAHWRAFMPWFFLASFVWNLVALGVMQGVSWYELAAACLDGSVFDIKKLRDYTAGIMNKLEAPEAELVRATEPGVVWDNLDAVLRSLPPLGLSRTVAQLIAFHIVLANLLVAFVLLSGWDAFFWVRGIVGAGSLPLLSGILLTVTILLPTALYIPFTYFAQRAKTRGEQLGVRWVGVRVVAGVLCLVGVICFYASFDPSSIVWVMVVQHTVFGIFLQFSVSHSDAPLSRQPPSREPMVEASQ